MNDYRTCEYVIASHEAFARIHMILDVVMPDDMLAEPDSAHQLVQLFYLREPETAVKHTTNQYDDCALAICVATAV